MTTRQYWTSFAFCATGSDRSWIRARSPPSPSSCARRNSGSGRRTRRGNEAARERVAPRGTPGVVCVWHIVPGEVGTRQLLRLLALPEDAELQGAGALGVVVDRVDLHNHPRRVPGRLARAEVAGEDGEAVAGDEQADPVPLLELVGGVPEVDGGLVCLAGRHRLQGVEAFEKGGAQLAAHADGTHDPFGIDVHERGVKVRVA